MSVIQQHLRSRRSGPCFDGGSGDGGRQGSGPHAACVLDEIWESSAFLDLGISQMWENALDFVKLKPDSSADQSSYFTEGQGSQNLMDLLPPDPTRSQLRTRWASPLGIHCREEEFGQDGTWGVGGRGRAAEDGTGVSAQKAPEGVQYCSLSHHKLANLSCQTPYWEAAGPLMHTLALAGSSLLANV